MPEATSPAETGVLPEYAWCSDDPAFAGVTDGPWSHALEPLIVPPDPEVLPDSPTAIDADLVPVRHRRIRLIGAYWHAGWPHAIDDALLRPEVLRRLVRAAESLPIGFGLAVWDAWRDPLLQAVLHETVYRDTSLPPGFVSFPDPDPRHCPPHASGGTVDLTLTWHNRPLSLGTTFDAFVAEASADALEPDGPELSRSLRRLLARAMGSTGFVPHPQEWWHWEYGTRRWAARTGDQVRFGHACPPPARVSPDPRRAG